MDTIPRWCGWVFLRRSANSHEPTWTFCDDCAVVVNSGRFQGLTLFLFLLMIVLVLGYVVVVVVVIEEERGMKDVREDDEQERLTWHAVSPYKYKYKKVGCCWVNRRCRCRCGCRRSEMAEARRGEARQWLQRNGVLQDVEWPVRVRVWVRG